MRKLKVLHKLLFIAALCISLAMVGCSGDDGSNGTAGLSAYQIAVQNGFTGTEAEWLAQQQGPTAAQAVEPESCATCHSGVGDQHQAAYDETYQDGVIQVSGLAYANDGANDVVTFQMTKDGANFDCRQADKFGIYFTQYDSATQEFTRDLSIAGTLSYDSATNTCTSTKAQNADFGDLAQFPGLIVLYGTDEVVNAPGHMAWGKYPFAGILQTNAVAVDYQSAANVAGCEKCHTKPFLKHAYIYGAVDVAGTTKEFWTCKACHYDTRAGHDQAWQQMVDDPQGWAAGEDAAAVPEYAYKAKLMNDVHMSHAMEFPYPQSMRNCVTCHEGKLDKILTADNFNLETCKSCHPMTGGTDLADAKGNFTVDTTKYALKTIIPHGFDSSTVCSECHKPGGIGPEFKAIHTGYDPTIYTADGTKYADAFTVSIDSASLSGNDLTINFSATENPDIAGLAVTDIVPTVQVALYGYDTKDFIASNHDSDADKNRLGEFTFGSAPAPTSPIAVIGGDGTWSVTFTLPAEWQALVADGTVKRAEDRRAAGSEKRRRRHGRPQCPFQNLRPGQQRVCRLHGYRRRG